MRERAISAAVARARPARRARARRRRSSPLAVALITATRRGRGLPAAARRPATRRSSALGTRPRPGGRRSTRRSRTVLDGSGLLLVAIGIVLVAVAAFTQADPRDGLQSLDGDGLRGVLRLAARRSSSGSATPAPASRHRRAARRSSAPSAAGSCSCSSRSGRSTPGAYLVGKTVRPDASS